MVGITVFLHPTTIVLLELSIIPLQLSRESYTGLSESTTIDDREEQSAKQYKSKLLIDAGIYIDFRFEHP